ncbi:MAG: hypothetical protein GY751_17565 [Bacteroidetes bacterium]|nr:hypothetical protein [Bacteroidota bacterium]
MEKPVNLISGLLTVIIICGLVFLNITANVRAADVPFFKKISGKVRLSIITAPPFADLRPPFANLRKLVQEFDSKKRIAHQFVGNTIPDGDVSIIFLENWKSAATLFDKDMGQIVRDMHELDPMTISRTVGVTLEGPNGSFPYIFDFYSYEAIDGFPAECVAKDILTKIEDVNFGNFSIKKCGDKE